MCIQKPVKESVTVTSWQSNILPIYRTCDFK